MLALIRFAFRWSLRLIALAVVLTVGIVVFRDVLLREWLLYRLKAVTGLETQLDRASIDPNNGSITLENLRIRNRPDFGGSLLLDAPGLELEFDTAALARREIRLRRARLHLAEASAVRSADGRTNLFVLQEDINRNASLLDLVVVSPPGFEFTGIQTLDLTLGTLHLVDLVPPGFHRPIHLDINGEVIHEVRSVADLHPLVLRLFLREITSGFAAALRTNTPVPRPKPPPPPLVHTPAPQAPHPSPVR